MNTEQTNPGGPLTICLDASALKESSCLLRLFYNTVQGYTEKSNSIDIEFGTAVHKFKAIFRDKGIMVGITDGVAEARKHLENANARPKKNKEHLNTDYLATVCRLYALQYEHDNFQTIRTPDGEALVELKFAPAHLVYRDDDIEIVLMGTMDEIGKWKNGNFAIADLKTTSAVDKDAYFRPYRLSTQLKFYRWIFHEYALAHPDSMFAEIEAKGGVECFIDGVFLRPTGVEFARSMRFNWTLAEIEEFGRLVIAQRQALFEAVRHWKKTGEIPPRYGMVNGACDGGRFGHCKYSDACSAPDYKSREAILRYGFAKRHYNPMTFQT